MRRKRTCGLEVLGGDVLDDSGGLHENLGTDAGVARPAFEVALDTPYGELQLSLGI